MSDNEAPVVAPPAPPAEEPAPAEAMQAEEEVPAAAASPAKRKSTGEATPTRESKRSRQKTSTNVYQPENFADKAKEETVYEGRGIKLGEIEALKEHLAKWTAGSDEMMMLHKLIYKGRPAKKDIRSNLLNFSGYLKPIPDGKTPEDMKEEDEELEVRRMFLIRSIWSYQIPGSPREFPTLANRKDTESHNFSSMLCFRVTTSTRPTSLPLLISRLSVICSCCLEEGPVRRKTLSKSS